MRKKGLLNLVTVGCLVAVVVLVLLVSSCAKPAPEAKSPIRIGLDNELTGVMSSAGQMVHRGYEIFLEEVGYEVAGRKIEVIEYDNKTDPKVSVEVARKLVEMDKVDIVVFGTNSAAAVAVRGYMETTDKPLVVIGFAGSEAVTLPPHPRVLRTSYSDGQVETPLGRYAAEKLGWKKVVLMGSDYIGSTGKLWAFQQGFQEKGGEVIQTILWPLGTVDMGPWVAKINPEADGIYHFDSNSVASLRFVDEYFKRGLRDRGIQLALYVGTEYDLVPQFGEKLVGIVSSGQYAETYDRPENKRFYEAYYKKYPEEAELGLAKYEQAAIGYEGMKFIWTALEKINGNVEDTEAFLKTMREITVEGVSSSLKLGETGSVIRDTLIKEFQMVEAEKRPRYIVVDVVPQVPQPPKGYTIMPGR